MYREPDRFHCVGTAVSGGVHYIGRSGGVFAAAAGPALAGGHIELWGNRRAVIEGSGGVLEYGPETIRIRLGKLCVRFCGRSLQIRCMSGNSMIVEGFISSVEYRV